MQLTQQSAVEDAILTQMQFRLLMSLVCLLVLGGIGGAFAFGLILVTRPQIPPPLIEYTATTYLPAHDGLCPGSALTYTPESIIHAPVGYLDGQPISVTVTRSYWDVTRDQQATNGSGNIIQVPPDTRNVPHPGTFKKPRFLILPDGLQPGQYLLLVSAKNDGTSSRGYNVPFTIRDNCE